MDVSPIVYAIPVFFLLIVFELVVSIVLKKRVYRVTDSVNDLSMGIIDQVGGALMSTITFSGYVIIWYNWRIFDMGVTNEDPMSANVAPWVWVACFMAKDFAYYWAHRMSHEMNVGWATHIAHHQSEEYNLSVALRQGVFQGFFFNMFYFPLAFLGFPPLVYGLCSIINTLYQFWIHTRLIGKLGPVELIMNTPSHHRVHHGRDIKYIDRNHAGVFIIWDRMFGTYQVEEEEPNYGLVSPLQSWNPFWGQVHYMVRLVKTAIAAPRPLDKIKLWFMAPAWQPEGLPAGPSSQERWAKGELKRYETRTPFALKAYVLLHFAPVNLLVTGWIRFEGVMSTEAKVASALLLFWTLLNLGAIFECRRWAPWSEVLRTLAMAAALHFGGPSFYGWPEAEGTVFVALNLSLLVLSLLILAARWSDFKGTEIVEPATEGRMYGPPETAGA
jgi:sterol desaturase/sphingolipid hydroxylase (fatty acid hydroxylase superfamily)